MLNVAILGAGSIVPDFLDAISVIDDFNAYAIYGRRQSLDKLNDFKLQYNMSAVYHDYEELLNDESVDVVYVALPNNLHHSFAKQAVMHGKHVIVEKPFAGSYGEADELFSLAREYHVMVFEAISNQYLPNYIKTRELLSLIGPLRIVQINFSQYSRRYDKFKSGIVLPAFDPNQHGGALMDLNSYNVHFAVGLFGKPNHIHYSANIQRGIDTSGILVMEYDGFQCVCTAAKDCDGISGISIQGEGGYICSDDKPNSYDTFSLRVRDQIPGCFNLNTGKPRLYYEMKAFADMMISGDYESCCQYAKHTLDVQEILDMARPY